MSIAFHAPENTAVKLINDQLRSRIEDALFDEMTKWVTPMVRMIAKDTARSLCEEARVYAYQEKGTPFETLNIMVKFGDAPEERV